MPQRRSSAYSSSRQRGKSLIRRWIPFVFGGFILIAIFVYILGQPPSIDPHTFCPQDTKNIGVTVLLIDISDKLTDSQAVRLKNELENISNVSAERPSAFLKKGDKMLVYFVEPEGQIPSMVFSMCHPGDIENRTQRDKLSEGVIFARKKWNEFTDDISASIDDKISSSTGIATSPLIETIQFIREKSFPPPDLMNKITNYRLVVWSDFLQNSAEGNHFETLGDYEVALKRNPIKLRGIELYVFQLVSKNYVRYQTNEHVVWWRKLFAKANATLKLWEKL